MKLASGRAVFCIRRINMVTYTSPQGTAYLRIHQPHLRIRPPLLHNPFSHRVQHPLRKVPARQLHPRLGAFIQHPMQRGRHGADAAGVVEDGEFVLGGDEEADFFDEGAGKGAGDDFGVFVAAAHVGLLEEGGCPVVLGGGLGGVL